ncbi:hypothetical protein BC628DRAFT_1418252 [Trametes gibbosa]|nr:hypothetical protein BC628DRAFT_1418252 [Trametes gibbosa]
MCELLRYLAVHAGYDTPTTPPRRHSDIEDEYVDEDTSDVQDPETSEFELKSSGSSKKRAMKASKTPQKRRKQKPSLQSSQRRNVDNAIKQLEPNADRPFCVVSRAFVDFTILEYAHVLPAATPSEVLDKLEWVWNMKHGTLDVDTPRNIHPLDVGLHRYFDHADKNQHDGWFWLPDVGDFKLILDMLDHYTGILAAAPSQHAKMRRNPDEFYKDQKVFKYRFVPFPAMRNSWAVRRLTVPTQTFTADTPVVQHYYPFSTMPIVSLHIPYHFVICDTGRKLNSVYGTDNNKMLLNFPQEFNMVFAVKSLYDAWMRVEPAWDSEGSFDIALGDPSPGGPDDGSGHVGSGGPSSHGGNAGSGGQGPPAQDGNRPQGGPGQGTLGTAPLGRRAALQSSLAPGDSASCFGPAEDDDDDELHDVPQEDEDSDEEWEDPEWGAWLEAWVEDVWEATHAHASSPYHSQETLVGAPMPSEKVAPWMGLPESTISSLCVA